jgi:hypothetical protein
MLCLRNISVDTLHKGDIEDDDDDDDNIHFFSENETYAILHCFLSNYEHKTLLTSTEEMFSAEKKLGDLFHTFIV